MDFYQRVATVCRYIPYGKVATYGQIALLCGKPHNARQVGYALNKKLAEKEVPAHRVVNQRGYLSGAGAFATPDLQKRQLEAEGTFVEGAQIDLNRYGWKNTIEDALILREYFMSNIIPVAEMDSVSHLFEGWQKTIIWSCLQGYMGKAYVVDREYPRGVQVIVGDFCFFAGEPSIDLVQHIPEEFSSQMILMIPQNEAWGKLIEQNFGTRAEKVKRYAIKKEPKVFDKIKLQSYIDELSPEYKCHMIDKVFYDQIMAEEWSRDLCAVFANYKDYEKNGLGVVALYKNKIVSGASSYTVYDEGIEIQIDTQKSYRRQGLALACGAKLILECLNRELYPSWDAQNLHSVALAEKLGYHMDKEYTTYLIEIRKNEEHRGASLSDL